MGRAPKIHKDVSRVKLTPTHLHEDAYTHTRTLMHNKLTYTASGERVCVLEGDNFVARPHRRRLSTE